MTKAQALELLKLLSALESWSFANGQKLPDYLHDQLLDCIGVLQEEILK